MRPEAATGLVRQGVLWLLLALMCVMVAVVCAWLFAALIGLTVVRDVSGDVISAVVTDDVQKYPMMRLSGGVFVGVAKVEGYVLVRCSYGDAIGAGFVTQGLFVRETVDGCRPEAPPSSSPQEN